MREGARALLTGCGLGGMRPNIVLAGFHGERHDGSDQLTQRLERRARASSHASRSSRFFGGGSGSAEISLETVTSQFSGIFMEEEADRGMDTRAYVGMLLDALDMGKHVGVHRNFGELPALLDRAAEAPRFVFGSAFFFWA